MPLITTHAIFALDILENLPKKITTPLIENKKLYLLFAQSFDPFLFKDFFSLHKKNYQNYFHTHETDSFFLNLIKEIKQTKRNHPDALCALYGHLSHYILDSTLHPYIFYKTGVYEKEKTKTRKYNGLHTNLEMHLDAYLYKERTNKDYKNFKIHTMLPKKIPKTLINLLNNTYQNTFNLPNMGTYYQQSVKQMFWAYKLLIEDKTGFKKRMYKLLDKLTPKKEGVYEYYSNHITKINHNYFNKERKIWYNPWTKEKSNKSIFDLYEEALKQAEKIFKSTQDFLNDSITEEEYKTILQDKNYCTGISYQKQLPMKYLEF